VKQLSKDSLQKLIDDLSLTDRISLSDIPEMALYMDQLLTFLDGKLSSFKRVGDDKLLTKTMINNYTKIGLIPKPFNKKYDTYHIILLILIFNLKNVLSISDIQSLFTPILKNIDTPDDDVIPLREIYSTFLELKQNEYMEFTSTFNEKHQEIKEKTLTATDKQLAELFLTVIMLVAQANASKRLAEKIIDQFFKNL
jgi:DNA-binding transcriptional MerR regulator